MNNDIFSLVETDQNITIIGITQDNKDDPLFFARHPWLRPKWKYITVETGSNGVRLYHIIEEDSTYAGCFDSEDDYSQDYEHPYERLRIEINRFLDNNTDSSSADH